MANNGRAQCFTKCVSEKLGFFNDNEGFNVEFYMKTSKSVQNKTEVRPKFEKCAQENSRQNDVCQWFYEGFNCLRKEGLF